MGKGKILYYDDVIKKIEDISKSGIINKEKPLGVTECNLNIEYLTAGYGKKDIVITGATHGAEIITTDFVIKLMEDICENKDNRWTDILEEYKIHFIPMLNPEGYLISTSAIKEYLKDKDEETASKLYYQVYKDDNEKEPGEKKGYQEMFEYITYECISNKYIAVKNHVRDICNKYNLPRGILQIWSANANGIDIQANSKFNPTVKKVENGEDVFMKNPRLDNINTAHPGPINCPYDKEKGFKLENETKAITTLLEKLHKENRLCMYLNYHSTGGLIYQRPAIPPKELIIDNEDIKEKEILNYLVAKAYAIKTKKNNDHYKIMTNEANATSTNDIFRLMYTNDLLIELSAMGGNPIAPYGDRQKNYNDTIKFNIDALRYTLKYREILILIAKECIKKINSLGEYNYDININLLDIIWKEFYERAKELDGREFNQNHYQK